MRHSKFLRTALTAAATWALFAHALPAEAQQTGTVSGQVIDAASRQPVSQVQVLVQDTRLGTMTDDNGRFQITGVPGGRIQLRTIRIGYQPAMHTVTIAAGQAATITLEITQSIVMLDEVVVTATGQQRKRELGNAVFTMEAPELVERSAQVSVANMLQGASLGVSVTGSSGTIGNASNIKIRGNSSINLENTPLVYLDGVRINTEARSRGVGGAESDRLLDLSPDEIESIEIVKGPAAATLYGTEAAAGVVQITTKRGASGDAQISARVEYGATWDPNDYLQRAWNPSYDLAPDYADTTYYIDVLKGSADIPNERTWYNPFRTGAQSRVALSMRGGTEDITYFTSVDYSKSDGVFYTNSRDGVNVRANIDFTPKDYMRVSLSNGFMNNHTLFNYNDGESWGYVGAVQLGTPEYAPLLYGGMVTCPLAIEQARYSGSSLQAATDTYCNPDRTFVGSNNYDRLKTMDNGQDVSRYIGSATISFFPVEYWDTRFTVGYDSYAEHGWNMIPNVPLKILDSEPDRTADHVTGSQLTVEGSSALNLDLTRDLNSITTVGMQYFGSLREGTTARGQWFPPGAMTVGNASERSASEDYVASRTLGFYVQQQFSYMDRFFLTPAVRWDDNSAFGENLGRIVYPRLSSSYVISDAMWFPEFFDQLRFRGAWGKSGKQPGPFDAVTLLSATQVSLADGSTGTGFAPSRLGNADLKPETAVETEIGFDMSIWDSRVGLEVTYYNQTTNDALILRPVAPSLGFTAGRWDNVGQVKNSGIETAINGTVLSTSALDWSFRGTFSTTKSEVTILDEPIEVGGRGLQVHQEGFPFGAYFMRPVTINSAGEVEVATEREFLGQPTPKWNGSLSSTLTLFNGRVTLYALVDAMGGHKQVNYTEVYMCRDVFGTCPARFEQDANGDPTDLARMKSAPIAAREGYHFLYSADFAKLRTVSVQFALPSSWAGLFGAQSARFTLIGSNMLTITDYPGVDPEVNSQGRENASQREFFSAGQTRSVLGRLALTF
jgi:TonB-linked SusC/RagA family outer membrane protein